MRLAARWISSSLQAGDYRAPSGAIDQKIRRFLHVFSVVPTVSGRCYPMVRAQLWHSWIWRARQPSSVIRMSRCSLSHQRSRPWDFCLLCPSKVTRALRV